MWGLARHKENNEAPPGRPVLDLSGPKLRAALEDLASAAEATGGVEHYVSTLTLKASLFEELLGKGRVGELTEVEFCDLCGFVATARRRVGGWLGQHGFSVMRTHLERLLAGWSDVRTTDERIAEFVGHFPADREHRWARDLAAEVLHFTVPEHYPLMTRWMWDTRTNTGVLREIWYAENPDRVSITAADDFTTFCMLRQELEGFLHGNGVFRDLPFYVDLLCAHVYAIYINDRGGQYLRSDFSAAEDLMAHTRRLLGLDAVDTETGRTRLKLIDGTAHVLGEPPRLQSV